MRAVRFISVVALVGLVVAGLVWLGRWPARQRGGEGGEGMAAEPVSRGPVVRLGLIPERDIYAQRKAYQALEKYLEKRVGMDIELVTNNTYEGVLRDFAEGQVDAAFLGSLVAALAMDQGHGEVLVKPEYEGGINTYCGVLFVRDDSSARSLADLKGKRIGAVKGTTAGHLYPMELLKNEGLLGTADAPQLAWVGTHDDVIREVISGNLAAGAVKDLRLNAFEARHRGFDAVRRIGNSPRVPENALVVRAGFPADVREKMKAALLAMNTDAEGRAVLKAMGLARYVACRAEEYEGLYEMVDDLGEGWKGMGMDRPAPRRPWAHGATSEPAAGMRTGREE